MPRGAETPQEKSQPGLVSAALYGLCPRCHARTLFAAPAGIAFGCKSCGLELIALERGARWAGLLTIIIAVVLILAALALDAILRPPLWLQLGFWAPVTVGGVIGALRFYKTALLYRQYQRSVRNDQGPQ